MRDEARPAVDLTMALTTLMLVAVGLVMIYSASAILAMGRYDDSYHFIKRQLLFAAAGICVLVAVLRLKPGELRALATPLMAGALALLALTLVPGIGKVGGGARRWIGFGPFRVQASELAKLCLVIFAADRLARPAPGKFDWKAGWMPVAIAAGASALLTLLEPDFGSAVMIVLVAMGLLYASGLNLRLLVAPALALLPLAAIVVLRSPYRMRRIAVFLDPWKDPSGAGFQITHSMIAFGTGGLFGQGLGDGRQKLFYLPEPHTDFIFATAGEEFGLLGCLTLLFLFALLLWRGLMISLRNQDAFLKLASLGVTLMLGLQVAVNLFVVTGLAPTKGSTLPFLSSGGSSLVVDLLAVGLLLNFSKEGR
jgi:cell division protein FtsW